MARQQGYLNVKEASSLLGVSSATLRNWDRRGQLRAVRHPVNRYRMYDLRDVIELQRQSTLFPAENRESEPVQPAEPHSLTMGEMRRLVRHLHRILRDNEGNSSLIERFDELTKMIYLKVHDERQSARSGKRYAFALDEQSDDVSVAGRARTAFHALVALKRELFPPRFREIRLNDGTVARLVSALTLARLSGSGVDMKGLAYEEVIRDTFDKGDNQQFFTPHPIVEFMVGLVSPFLTGLVGDPACGTGGFLLAVDSCKRGRSRSPRVNLLGLEIDERLAWVSGINLDMHDADGFSVRYLPGAGSLGPAALEYAGQLDVILTNPPFGSDLSDPDALRGFRLGKDRSSRRRGVLFIERCLRFLKPGGVLAIIIDDGVLNSESNADARSLILDEADPLAIVSLPETAFMPYATVKASILFLQKKGGARRRIQRRDGTFFADARVVGRRPNGDSLARVNDLTGRLELDSDLPWILSSWNGSGSDSEVKGRARDVCVFSSRIPSLDDPTFREDGYRLDLSYHHPSRKDADHALHDARYPIRTMLDLCEERSELTIPSQTLEEDEITYVGLANIEADTGLVSPVSIKGAEIKSAVRRFVGGDILFAKMRPELRKVCLIPRDIEEGYASSECLVLVPRFDAHGEPVMDPELLALLLRSDLVYGQIVHHVTGIGRPRLRPSTVLNARLPVPPPSDQARILELYRRSQKAAVSLLSESIRAQEESTRIGAEARRQVVRDLMAESRVQGSG